MSDPLAESCPRCGALNRQYDKCPHSWHQASDERKPAQEAASSVKSRPYTNGLHQRLQEDRVYAGEYLLAAAQDSDDVLKLALGDVFIVRYADPSPVTPQRLREIADEIP